MKKRTSFPIIIVSLIVVILFATGIASWIISISSVWSPKENTIGEVIYGLNFDPVVYNAKIQLPTVNSGSQFDINNYNVYYKNYNDEKYTPITYENGSANNGPINAGVYQLMYEDKSDTTKFVEKQFTIQKADVSVKETSWPSVVTLTYGETLDIAASDGYATHATISGLTVYGTFVLEDMLQDISGTSTSLSKEQSTNIIFVPLDEDADNYNTVTSTRTLTINMDAVAYSGSTYYSSVEYALESVKSDNIYVIPGKNPTVYRDCTVLEGVTLNLPYEAEKVGGPAETGAGDSDDYPQGGEQEKYARDFPDKYKKSEVLISSNITLTVNGVLTIGGILTGGGGHHTSGHTLKNYAQITLSDNSNIVCNGTINCYGYIIGTYANNQHTKVQINNGGSISMPFIVQEHRGGTVFSLIYFGGLPTAPFLRFHFNNVESLIVFESGSEFIGLADLWAGDTHNTSNIKLIGASAEYLIQTYDNTTIEARYYHSTQKINLDIYGNIQVNSLSINVQSNNITTKNVLLPVSWYYDITFNKDKNNNNPEVNTEVNLINQNIKLLPGATLTINQGVTVNANKIMAYSSLPVDTTGCPKYPTEYPTGEIAGQTIPPGKVIINGKLIINDIAGEILTNSTNATLQIINGTYLQNQEVISRIIVGEYTTGVNYENQKEYAKLHLYKNGKIDNYFTFIAQGTYHSIKAIATDDYGWRSETAKIYFDENGGTFPDSALTETADLTIESDGHTICLEDIDTNINHIPTREHYTFMGWSISKDGNNSDIIITYSDSDPDEPFKIKPHTIYTNTTLYAVWEPIKYEIKYSHNYLFDGTEGDFALNNNQSSFTVETKNVLLNTPTHTKNYTFGGWYYNDGAKISMLNGYDLISYMDANKVYLYAYWYPEDTDTYTVKYVNERNSEVASPETENLIIINGNWNEHSLPNISYKNDDDSYRYYFIGWYTEKNKQITSFSEDIFDDENSVTLYAKWGVKYTVKFMNGETQVDSLFITPNSTFIFPSFTYSSDVYPLELSSDSSYITEYLAYWNDGEKNYQCGTSSPVITSNVTYNQIKTEVTKYYKVTLTNYYTQVVITVSNGDLLTGTTATKETKYTFNNSKSTFLYEIIYIKNGSSVQCAFTYHNRRFANGYKIYENGKQISSGSKSFSTPSNPSAFTINSTIYEIGSSSGNSDNENVGCVFSDAQILMADGTTKQVTEIKVGDLVTTWSFEEGKFVVRPVIFFEALDSVMVDKITLYFDDNTQLEIAYAQSFFDIDKLEYFSINADNVHEYVGVNIMTHDNGKVSSKQIVDYKVEIVMEDVYEIITGYDYSFIYDNVLTMEPFMLYKLPFEITSELKYDEELMKEDIEKYGLYAYDEWYMHGTEQMFDLMNVKYFKVAIEKGYYTLEYLLELYQYYFVSDNIS